jgi:hypothetical protein
MKMASAVVVGLFGRVCLTAGDLTASRRSWRNGRSPFILPLATTTTHKAAFVSSWSRKSNTGSSTTTTTTRESQCARLWAEPNNGSSRQRPQRQSHQDEKSVKRAVRTASSVSAASPSPPLSPKKSPLQRTDALKQAVPLVVTPRATAELSTPSTDPSPLQTVSTAQQQPQSPLRLTLATISREELSHLIVDCWNFPAFRVNQVWHWIRNQGVLDVAQMTNVPAALQAKLAEASRPHALQLVAEQVSRADGTIKRAYQCHSDVDAGSAKKVLLESVLMGPYDNGHYTACISSQAGCAQGCVFCATGQMGLVRQLSSDEIYEQVVQYSTLLQQRLRQETAGSMASDDKSSASGGTKPTRLSNIVFMGMGEVRNTLAMKRCFVPLYLSPFFHVYICSLWPITTMSR